MQIKIFYCVVWNYKPSAVSLAAELKESFEVEAELLSGERGDFEVVADGEKVFSKKILSRFPEPGEITQLIRMWWSIRINEASSLIWKWAKTLLLNREVFS